MKFHHLGVAVKDMNAGMRSYTDLFGYRLLSGPFDDPIQSASVCFMGTGREGDFVVELIAPLTEDSHVHSLLAKTSAAYHTCYEVTGMEQALADARAKGCLIVRQPAPAVAFDGRRIAWLFTPTRHLVEVLEQ